MSGVLFLMSAIAWAGGFWVGWMVRDMKACEEDSARADAEWAE